MGATNLEVQIENNNSNKQITTNCDFCNKIIIMTENKFNKARKHFCNKECFLAHQKLNSTELICPVCNKSFTRKNSQIKNIKDISNATCSKKCCYELRKTLYLGENNHQYGLTGSKNSSWKSDEKYCNKNDNHYKMIRVENHPFRNKDNFVLEHRLVAEKYLLTETNSVEINGTRYLKPECVVHHIDFDKHNNDVSNLYVFELESMHTLFHNLYRCGKIKNLNEFLTYYQSTYIEKLYKYDWLYKAYVMYDLSINQISKLFNIPYKSVQTEIYKHKLDEIKRKQDIKEKRLQFIVSELS